jgi:hypothetical protein
MGEPVEERRGHLGVAEDAGPLAEGQLNRLPPSWTMSRSAEDKAKVEARVRFAQTYILGRMRNRTFFSLEEANVAIGEAMERMNSRPTARH